MACISNHQLLATKDSSLTKALYGHFLQKYLFHVPINMAFPQVYVAQVTVGLVQLGIPARDYSIGSGESSPLSINP